MNNNNKKTTAVLKLGRKLFLISPNKLRRCWRSKNWNKCGCGVSGMIWWKNPSDSTVAALIFTSRLIWTQPADTLTEINCQIAAEHFAPWNWIEVLSDEGRTMFVVALCKHSLQRLIASSFLNLFIPFQNEAPPYESRIAAAKLLIESEEYEVKRPSCSVVVGVCVLRCGRATWPFYVRVCLFFLVNSTGGGKAMSGLYALQSLVSIIEEWYLQRGTVVRRRRRMEEKEGGGNIYIMQWTSVLMNCCYIIETAHFSTKSLINFLCKWPQLQWLTAFSSVLKLLTVINAWSHFLWLLPPQQQCSNFLLWSNDSFRVNPVGYFFMVITDRKWGQYPPSPTTNTQTAELQLCLWACLCGRWAVRCISEMTTSRSIVSDMSFVFILPLVSSGWSPDCTHTQRFISSNILPWGWVFYAVLKSMKWPKQVLKTTVSLFCFLKDKNQSFDHVALLLPASQAKRAIMFEFVF